MFSAIFNTFNNCRKIPELKSRILFTLVVLAICRIEAVIRRYPEQYLWAHKRWR